jgi:uncharacterized DUF497 family protein
MECEWDEKKNKLNQKKHGISFEEAKEVFQDPNAIEFFDEEHSENEDRYICLGDIGELVIVVVIFTDRNGIARLISARSAEPIEEETYYEHLKKTT